MTLAKYLLPLTLLALFAASYNAQSQRNTYLVTLPKALIIDTVHKVQVQVSTVPATIRIDTTDPDTGLAVRGQTYQLKSNYQDVPYIVPIVNPSTNVLKLEIYIHSLNGKLTANHQVKLSVIKNNFIIFAETSKPIYKPGELVQFRLLPVYPTDLKTTNHSGRYKINKVGSTVKLVSLQPTDPVQLNFDLIYIVDPNEVRMAQWRDLTWEKAMNLSYQLNQDTSLGTWKAVGHFGDQIEEIHFQVQKYVLPKFTVQLKPPTQLLVSDQYITFVVCSQYWTGRPMKASIQTEICLRPDTTYPSQLTRPCIHSARFLNGTENCVAFREETAVLQLTNMSFAYWASPVHLSAKVVEDGTGETVYSNATIAQVQDTKFRIVVDSPDYFKPGMPYYGKLRTENHDGTPYPGANLLVSVSHYTVGNKWAFKKHYQSDDKGQVYFILPAISVRQQVSVQIHEIRQQPPDSCAVNQMRLANQKFTITPWSSQSDLYLQVNPRKTGKVICPGTITIDLQANTQLDHRTMYVQIFSRGRIVAAQEVPKVGASKKCEDQDNELGHYKCATNTAITCLPGWTGNNCLKPICDDGCNTGVCIAPGECICNGGRAGRTCNLCVRCSNCKNGYCVDGNDCQCYPGWSGYICRTHVASSSADDDKVKTPVGNTEKSSIKKTHEDGKVTLFTRTIEMNLPPVSGPENHVVIYFLEPLTNQTEVVADFIKLPDLVSCVTATGAGKFEFNASEVAPGSNVELQLVNDEVRKTCSLRISDVSVNTFGSSGGVDLNTLVLRLIQLNQKVTKVSYPNPFTDLIRDNCTKDELLVWPEFPPVEPVFDDTAPRRRPSPIQVKEYDSAKSFDDAGIYTLTNMKMVNRRCYTYRWISHDSATFASARGGEAAFKTSIANEEQKEVSQIKARLREFFPETWKFEYLVDPPSKITLKVPDSITSWRADAYCMTPRGLWIAPTRTLTVIMPFFVQLTLPYSIKRNEILQVPVKLFNYVDECYEIRVELQVRSAEFNVIGQSSRTTCICLMEQKTTYFQIVPVKIGRLDVTILAASLSSKSCAKVGQKSLGLYSSDAVKEKLLVVPEGIPDEGNFGDLFCVNGDKATFDMSVSLPERMVSGSLRSYLVYSGDVMGPTFDNLNQLIRMPYGSGEQNMLSLVPSICVLDYLKATKIDKPDFEEKAKRYISIGYLRELDYRHADGSYSEWGPTSDILGSTRLTAFVYKSFTQAKLYATIADHIVNSAAQFIYSQQNTEGCFVEKGKVIDRFMTGGIGLSMKDEPLLTAYILTVLKSNSSSTQAALKCVEKKYNLNGASFSHLKNYTLAVVTYAWSIHEPYSTLGRRLRSALETRAIQASSTEFWSDETINPDDLGRPWHHGTSAQVETTAYAYLALENFRRPMESLRTIRWLTGQRNSLGGFYSTQDTVMGLEALTHFGQMINYHKETHLQLHVDIAVAKFTHQQMITDDDRVVMRKIQFEVPSETFKWKVSGSINGSGCVYLQLSNLFNLPSHTDVVKRLFNMSVSVQQNANSCHKAMITVCSSYLNTQTDSNMILLRVELVTGWVLDGNALQLLRAQVGQQDLRRVEIDRGQLAFFYDAFTVKNRGPRCVGIHVHQQLVVRQTKPAVAVVQDYYQPQFSDAAVYKLSDCSQ